MNMTDIKDSVSESVLIIEPFYGGSHKQLVDLLTRDINHCCCFTQTAKKWHWRARTSALHFAFTIPANHNFKVLFCSSVLNLAELIALRPDIGQLKKVIYFHENQLVYPVRKQQDRDFQYGYNQILSCLVADVVLFNSHHNMSTFLTSIKGFLKIMPDYRPQNLADRIRPKCHVLYFPMQFSFPISEENANAESNGLDNGDIVAVESAANSVVAGEPRPLHIVWPHRWEHDKDPDTFFNILYRLKESKHQFKLSVLGQSFDGPNAVFDEAKCRLESEIVHWGYVESKTKYFEVLKSADLVISTAQHEFFGVAMLEAAFAGCYPLCPNRLVYPEIFPTECLYESNDELLKRLKAYCEKPDKLRCFRMNKVYFNKFSWNALRASYTDLLSECGTDEVQPT